MTGSFVNIESRQKLNNSNKEGCHYVIYSSRIQATAKWGPSGLRLPLWEGCLQVIIRTSRIINLSTSNINTENSQYRKNLTIKITSKVPIKKLQTLSDYPKQSSKKKNPNGAYYKSLH